MLSSRSVVLLEKTPVITFTPSPTVVVGSLL